MKGNLKRYFQIFLLTAICSFSGGGSVSAESFINKTFTNFSRQWSLTQPEKAYLQLDKSTYSAGEKIWLRGYVVNAVTHQPKTLSRFLYVELLDRSGDLIQRIKLKKDSVGFDGYFNLKNDIQAGTYTIRAYTYWMQNAGTDYFFTKNIYIGNPIDDNVVSQADFSDPKQGKIVATITFTDANKNPYSGKSVDVSQSWNNPDSKKTTFITNKNGKIAVPLQLDTLYSKTKLLDVSISEPNLNYKHRFFLPVFSKDFDLKFMPESGNLIAGQLQVVAFKAIGRNGLGVNLSGTVYNSRRDEVTDFKTTFKGMGKFTIQVDSGETYYAIIKTDDGTTKRIDLPKIANKSVNIHMVSNKGKILYEVTNRTTVNKDALCLMIHQRGKLLAVMPLKDLEGQISENLLPPGIVSLSVVDTLGHLFCERLHFVRPTSPVTVDATSDKAVYNRREPVKLSFVVKSPDGNPCLGNYSLSVTDKTLVPVDSLSANIVTNMLLTSDLKGYVEEPGSYFSNNPLLDRERLDLLMLTQGWTRFNTSEVLAGRFQDPKYFLEVGQALSGKVLNLFNKPSKKCMVLSISAVTGKVRMSQTDSLGRYMISGIEFKDSTSFLLKATKSKSFGDVEIVPDKDEFPLANIFIPFLNNEQAQVSKEFLWQSKQKYYMEGGMRMVNLEGVTVKANKIDKDKEEHFYAGMEDRKIDQTKLGQFPGMGLLEILSMEPGVQVRGDDVTIRGSLGGPVFYLNDIEAMSIDEVKYLTSDDIEDISIFKGASAAIFGSNGGNGVIAITLKKGVERKAETPPSLVTVTPLGFQKPQEFYMPKYDVPEELKNPKEDLRTTIYWAPHLTTDANGVITTSFYTADKAHNYSYVLEGVSGRGELCHFQGTLVRKGE